MSLFDVASGSRLGTLVIDDADLNYFALAPDGSAVALPGGGGTLIWDLDPARWVAAACDVAGRSLTPEEWDANIGDLAPYHETCPA